MRPRPSCCGLTGRIRCCATTRPIPVDPHPDVGDPPPPADDVTLAWVIADAAADQDAVRLELYEEGGREGGEAPLYAVALDGDRVLADAEEANVAGGGGGAAAPPPELCAGWRGAHHLPAHVPLIPGNRYAWYLWAVNDRGVETYAPVEAVFTVAPAGAARDNRRRRS